MGSGRFDFTELLASTATDYIGRELVEAEIKDDVDRRAHGVCVVIGEPGSGKTALAAAAVSRHGWLHYFVRRGHVDFSIWRDPYAFLATVGYQLWDRYGDGIFPPSVTVDVRGRARTVGAGGTFIGADVERLVPLPWRSQSIAVDLDVGDVAGTTIGARISEIVEDYRFLPAETFRQVALIDPLRRLAEQRPGEKVVLWVDGLDEEFDQPSGEGAGATITSLLLNSAEAEDLGNVVIVASSRPERHLESLRRGDAVTIRLSADRFAAENRQTLTTLVDRELSGSAVADELTAVGWDTAGLRAEILRTSQNNFLYAEHFFLAVRSGETGALHRHELPSTLDELHSRLIARLAGAAPDRYPTTVQPVVAALAAAREPLDAAQLTAVTRLGDDAVKGALTTLRPYLAVAEQPGTRRRRFGFFHDTFRETLMDPAHSDEIWHVDRGKAHDLLADRYLALEATGWEGIDDYGLRFLTEHLQLGTTSHRRLLVALLGESWRRARRTRSATDRPFADDLGRGVECLSSVPPHETVPGAVKLTLMAARVDLASQKIPDGALAVMARLGQHVAALEHVRPGPTANSYVWRAAEVIEGLAASPVPDRTLIHETRMHALASMRDNPNHGSLSTLLTSCPAGDDIDSRTFLDEAVEQFRRAPAYWATPAALTQIGRLLGAYDVEAADSAFAQALDAIPRSASSAARMYEARLIETWTAVNPEAASKAVQSIRWTIGRYSLRALLRAPVTGGRSPGTQVRDLVQQAAEMLPHIADPYERAMCEIEIARVETPSEAASWLERAVTTAEEIGGAADPDNNLQNRMEMAAEVWIAAASVAAGNGFGSGAGLVERAWRESQTHGVFNRSAGLRELVRAQLARRPEILEARLGLIDDPTMRADLLIAAADVVANTDQQGATLLLAQAMSLSGSEIGPLGDEAELALAIAVRYGRDRGLAVLESAGAQHFETDWRFHLIDTAEHDDEARQWVFAAVDAWARRVDGHTLERAAVLASLPGETLDRLADRIETLAGEIHRVILLGVLSARIARLDRNRADAMLGSACERLDRMVTPDAEPSASTILGFFAGAWWEIDQVVAGGLWRDSLLLSTTAPGADPQQRSSRLVKAIEALHLRAPTAALVPLLCHQPPHDPLTLSFVVPGPGTPPLLAAGCALHDFLHADVVARLMATSEPARRHFEAIEDPVLASMTASLAASRNIDCGLEERADWCRLALDHAAHERVPHHIRCLLHADAAEALRVVGLASRAADIADRTAHDIVENGYAFGALYQKPAYAAALGRCLKVLGGTQGPIELSKWIWEARVLQTGLFKFLAYLPPLLPEPELGPLLDAVEVAGRLFASARPAAPEAMG